MEESKGREVNRSPGYRLEVRKQDLVPRKVDGNKEFGFQWKTIKKLDVRNSFEKPRTLGIRTDRKTPTDSLPQAQGKPGRNGVGKAQVLARGG